MSDPEFIERKFGDLTVRIDRVACISTESCIDAAPGLFHIDDESLVNFQDPSPAIDRQKLVDACTACPVDALFVIDAQGKQLVPEND